jgi:hypothetical protein
MRAVTRVIRSTSVSAPTGAAPTGTAPIHSSACTLLAEGVDGAPERQVTGALDRFLKKNDGGGPQGRGSGGGRGGGGKGGGGRGRGKGKGMSGAGKGGEGAAQGKGEGAKGAGKGKGAKGKGEGGKGEFAGEGKGGKGKGEFAGEGKGGKGKGGKGFKGKGGKGKGGKGFDGGDGLPISMRDNIEGQKQLKAILEESRQKRATMYADMDIFKPGQKATKQTTDDVKLGSALEVTVTEDHEAYLFLKDASEVLHRNPYWGEKDKKDFMGQLESTVLKLMTDEDALKAKASQ